MADANSGDPEADEVGDPAEFYLGLMKEITPEKADALQEIVDSRSIRFCVDETEERVFFAADTASGLITVGLLGATRLMAHAFAYTSTYAAELIKIASEKTQMPLPADYQQKVDSSSELLTWAVTADVRSSLPEFEKSFIPEFLPDDLVGLVQNCLPEQLQALASKIFANAFVWVLYHEVSHVQRLHVECKGFESLRQEKEADRMAAEWMLDSETLTPHERWIRQIGVAVALMWLTARTVYIGPGTMTTHPASHDRLYQVLQHVLDPENGDVWFFVTSMLSLHVRNNKALVVDDKRIGSDFRENANYLIDILASSSGI